MTQVFKDLIARFPTWEVLGPYLKSAEGGSLRLIGISPLVLIRYQKGESNFSVSHVKYFRSVIWNTETNRPVSVTPCKSEEGEFLPTETPIADYSIETFVDGVLIGQFWDGTSWKIHTRSMLGANCRYYSEKTFKTMFYEAMPTDQLEHLDKTVCYSWILQHPENRIVSAVRYPRISLVDANRIAEDGTLTRLSRADLSSFETPNVHSFPTWSALNSKLLEWNERYHHNFQGFIIRNSESRWKIRTESYNKARQMRDNTPRRDYVWLTQWKAKTLTSYVKIFPEEKFSALALVSRWKTITTDLFRIYTAKFKAKSSPEVPPKFKGILHAMHQYYYNTLKPAGKTLTLPEAIEWMNLRDVPQMLYLINFELRAAIAAVEEVPFEPSVYATPTSIPAAVPAAEPVAT